MKKLFIFLNIMLSACVVWLIYTHISHTPRPPDKELELTPETPGAVKIGIFDKENASMPGDLSYIYENNIFLPNRGNIDVNGKAYSSTGSKPYTGSFELTGICKIGETEGAVITSSGSRKTTALKSKFYRVNEQIGETNYKLIEVSPEKGTAVVSNGMSREILELDRNDSGSLKRRKTEAKNQELAAKKTALDFNRMKPKPPKPAVKKPIIPKTISASKKKKTAGEIAALRKKILERMAQDKKKRNAAKKKENNK